MNAHLASHRLPTEQSAIAQRVAALDWNRVAAELDARGYAVIAGLLTPAEAGNIASLYAQADRFRGTVVMARHGYGRGEYKYFDYPLPQLVAELREAAYARLAAIANRWNATLHSELRYPEQLPEFLARCREAGQCRPTPLLLRYETDDYNCLHQDLYGEHAFPLQLAVLLSAPERDFSGGEFILTEQRPRMQSRAEVIPLQQGDAVVFAVHQRPVQGTRGFYRVALRHGVSRLRSGRRFTLGVIFHDAR